MRVKIRRPNKPWPVSKFNLCKKVLCRSSSLVAMEVPFGQVMNALPIPSSRKAVETELSGPRFVSMPAIFGRSKFRKTEAPFPIRAIWKKILSIFKRIKLQRIRWIRAVARVRFWVDRKVGAVHTWAHKLLGLKMVLSMASVPVACLWRREGAEVLRAMPLEAQPVRPTLHGTIRTNSLNLDNPIRISSWEAFLADLWMCSSTRTFCRKINTNRAFKKISFREAELPMRIWALPRLSITCPECPTKIAASLSKKVPVHFWKEARAPTILRAGVGAVQGFAVADPELGTTNALPTINTAQAAVVPLSSMVAFVSKVQPTSRAQIHFRAVRASRDLRNRVDNPTMTALSSKLPITFFLLCHPRFKFLNTKLFRASGVVASAIDWFRKESNHVEKTEKTTRSNSLLPQQSFLSCLRFRPYRSTYLCQ